MKVLFWIGYYEVFGKSVVAEAVEAAVEAVEVEML
jgi:hypothetical protein